MERDCSDEHEEGEIIDDFEDISDYSIPTSYSGKSVTHRDLLQDVSLSSISDNEADALNVINTYNHVEIKHVKRKRKSIHCRRKKKHKIINYHERKNKCVKRTSITSDTSEDELDAKTQKQLKDAIHIDKSQIQHNSLRTRLKAMLNNENTHTKNEDEDIETLRTLALLSNSKEDIDEDEKASSKQTNNCDSGDDKDDELIELRLAALKSAVLKKVPEIRKRKYRLQPRQGNTKIHEINKENNVNQENNIKEHSIVKTIESPKCSKINNDNIKNEMTRNISVEEDIDIMRAKLLASMSKKITSDMPVTTLVPNEKKIVQSAQLVFNKKYTLLKQEMKVKPLIINLNDSDSDTDITTKTDQKVEKDTNLVNCVSEFLKKQRAAVEAKSKVDTRLSVKKGTLDKSVVKLLPKSQQKEYHILKQKLLLAKRRRIRKTSQRIENNKSVVFRKTVKEAQDGNAKQQPGSKPVGLQRALDDIQIKKNGRLQMKGKYKALAPLLQKVNQASIERKQYALEIKVLLENLQKARDKLAVSHQSYSNLVTRLTNQKNAIDRRENKLNKMKIVNNNINIVKSTSTPIRQNIEESTCDISSINTTQDSVKEQDVISNTAQVENKEVLPCNNGTDQLSKYDSENVLKQYVSPLDNKNRDTVEDPLITFCPFELFGVCKDPECKFNHCSKT